MHTVSMHTVSMTPWHGPLPHCQQDGEMTNPPRHALKNAFPARTAGGEFVENHGLRIALFWGNVNFERVSVFDS